MSDTTCGVCEAGKSSTGGAQECTVCEEGEYSSEGAGFCATAKAGEEIVKDGELRVAATKCTAGRYSTGSVDSCTSCGTGFSNEGASKCEFCGPGKHLLVDEGGAKSCEECVAGRYSETGSNIIDGCLECEVGTCSAAGASFCPIAGGGFIPTESRDNVVPCPSGTYSSGTADECSQCPPGSFSFPMSPTCSSCNAGHYFVEVDSEMCVKVELWDEYGDGCTFHP